MKGGERQRRPSPSIFYHGYPFLGGPFFGKQIEQVKSEGHLIISIGLGSWSELITNELTNFLQKHKKLLPFEIYVDRGLSFNIKTSNFKPCNFSKDIIASAQFVLGRPSLGIVTDCFEHRIPFMPISASDDEESLNNRHAIVNMYSKLGINLSEIWSGLAREKLGRINLPLGGQNHISKNVESLLEDR